ncbi:hypothetical protein [Bremerella sp. P1]|uniref:hypothetical protein n=1 Tax=Bremerella sp. P1 TaxID=3026424 RepID=UPI0023686739|nr:hypothetical protein [Bremerella sp. P1]WDI43723.1 hypothetical protein PSR63_07155 [Bremerella sp. P1]
MTKESPSGPPPMPNQPTPPHMPSDKSSASVGDISIETEHDPLDEVIAGVPRVAGILLAAEVVMLLSGLFVPTSFLLTVPLLTMLGFWMVVIGARIAGKLNFVQRLASRMGQFSIMLQALGLSPLLFGGFGILVLSNADGYTGNIARFLVVIYTVFFIPAVLFVRAKAHRHLGKSPLEISKSELIRLGASVGVAVVLVSGLFNFLTPREPELPVLGYENAEDFMAAAKAERAAQMSQIEDAHALWESDDRFEAVRKYKSLLRSSNVSSTDEAAIYRRVIEHEAEYGDAGSARDWALRAYEEGRWNAALRKLTFSSEAATTIWEDVVRASQNEE